MNDMTPPATMADPATRLARCDPDMASTIRAMGRTILDLTARIKALECRHAKPRPMPRRLHSATQIAAAKAAIIIATLVDRAAADHQVSAAIIMGFSRKSAANLARQWVMSEAEKAGCPIQIIARELGKRDVSTIRHGVNKQRARVDALK